MKDSANKLIYTSNTTNGNSNGFFIWLRHPNRGLPYLLCSILFMLVMLFCLFHYYLSNYHLVLEKVKSSDLETIIYNKEFQQVDTIYHKPPDDAILNKRIEELKNIKLSVNKELLTLEKQRKQLLTEIVNLNGNLEFLKASYDVEYNRVENMKLNLKSLNVQLEDMKKNNQPSLLPPLKILTHKLINDEKEDDVFTDSYNGMTNSIALSFHNHCSMSTCFDYSRCSVFSQFPVYIYNLSVNPGESTSSSLIKSSISSTKKFMSSSNYATSIANEACIFVHLFDGSKVLEEELFLLKYWQHKNEIHNGLNHVIISLQSNVNVNNKLHFNHHFNAVKKSLLIQSFFMKSHFREGFDFVIPPVNEIATLQKFNENKFLPMMVPIKRKFLISYSGGKLLDATFKHSELLKKSISILNEMRFKFKNDGFLFEFTCPDDSHTPSDDISLCGDLPNRLKILQQSTFSLILMADFLTSEANYAVSTVAFQIRLLESLRSGAVPIILAVEDDVELPLANLIDWSGALVWLPVARITELHYVIRSIIDEDILEMRSRGRRIYETYFSTIHKFTDSLLAAIRSRIQIPPFRVKDEQSFNYFDEYDPIVEPVTIETSETEEVLGPFEAAINSAVYQRNFTSFLYMHAFEKMLNGFHLYPTVPFKSYLSTDAQHSGSSYGYRPIGDGLGGSGDEFKEALGGNFPKEQFTIVILTYERETVLLNAVTKFKNLPYLNKVIIIWNNNKPPSPDLKWPDIGVKVELLKTSRNSLNNRFLPYDSIVTEAVLSIDDDVHLRHDEIVFAFRVWRQNRDQIVGFPGRFVSYYKDTNTFMYNSNYTCEMSMVLTGAAFIHKFYMYMYSHVMPQIIRDKVDEYLNCEDIAMNFLVSHIARKPPIKVTSRWTFKCLDCPNTLYADESHFTERHQCIQFFAKVYGYLPLLTTQFRADSILFKTRIPHNKQKCFKFI